MTSDVTVFDIKLSYLTVFLWKCNEIQKTFVRKQLFRVIKLQKGESKFKIRE